MSGDNTDIMHLPAAAEGGKGEKKRLSIERIYQKKSQLEHILLRPDTYIGSVESVTQAMWVYDSDLEQMVQRDITFVPGLYKIFDEIIVNAADNKQRDPGMTTMKIDIDPENNKIKVWNNGRGIPVIEHKTEKMYVPTMIFGHLLTSSNYDDSQKKVTGGRNGYGAKLCNIFSTKFIVETSCKEYHKAFKQTWIDNMGKTKEPTITDAKNEDFTSITFFPDLQKFKMESLTKDMVDLFTRRAYDIAASSRGVKVFLNGKRLPVKNFKDYINLYLKDKTDDNGQPLPVIHEAANERWEVAVTLSEKGFQQVSFVNSIATTKGGRHVDNVTDQVVTKLIEVVKKKNKGGIAIKPFQVKNHLWIFVNCLIENPTFDSQTKESMTLQAKQFGSKCTLSEKFINQVSKCGIVDNILSWMKFKAQTQLNKKLTSSKTSKMKGIPKLDDANDAGTRNSRDCTLILTEGDSAKSLAVAGLGVVGRDKYGVFPLKGKVLNVREATHKQIMDNAEINNIIKIMGLQFKEKYNDPDTLKNLRYGKLMIMTDQDQDGSHIKGLLINFMHHFWPNLLKYNVIEEFITPIVKVTKGKTELSFYSLPEFEEWKRETENWHTYRVKYYKGLGTSTSKEAKEYFSDMERHKIPFKYTGAEDDAAINLAFSKKKIEERKEWLTSWMEDRKRRSEMGLPENFLYGKGTKAITYNDFINRELILYSNMDNTRSIPSMVDGLKPGQRKVLFTCLKRNLTKELKVAQLAGSVAEMSAYHHGEASLMNTIINLAQNFVGSNNLNILQPIGQFGTRLHGGKDAASPRYIFTALSPLARMLFNINDDPLLKSNFDDNLKIEPEWYCPIIPMVLVNGAEGIGTGWSTKLPNYDVREIIANIKRMLDGEDPLPLVPSYKNFKGTIEELSESRFIASGEVAIIDDQTIEITELPIRTWTQNYKEDVLEVMLHGTEKTPSMITDFKEYHTDSIVKFVVKMTPEKLAAAEEQGLHKVFKLQSNISTNTMVLFDHNGCIRRYEDITDVLREYFDVRLSLYQKRKEYMEGLLTAEANRLENIARFIMEKIDGLITIENKPKKELIQMLVRRGYDSDPLKRWKELQAKDKEDADDNEEEDDDESTTSGSSGGPDFNYILNNPLWCLTKEKKDALLKQRDEKKSELEALKKKSKEDLWMYDLEEFMQNLEELEQKEREDEKQSLSKPVKIKGKGVKARKVVEEMNKPSPMGRRVVPRIDTAMKNKADTAANKIQKAKLKKEAKNLMDCFDKEEEADVIEHTSLAERLEKKTGIKSPTSKVNGQPKTEAVAEKPAKKKQVSSKESSSESLTVDSSEDDSDDEEEIQAPVMDPLAPHWSSVLDAVDVPPFLCDVGPSHSLPTTANEKDFFDLLFCESCLLQITEGTNKHAAEVQERKGHDPLWSKCTPDEIRAYIGILIFMGVNRLPDYKLYWSKNKFLANAGLQDVMPVRRYEKITQYLHCSSDDFDDPLYKIRPVMSHVTENIRKVYKPHKHQTIDEGMIAYKGRHKAKQYIPSKPTRWGLKVWLRCDSLTGFCHQLDLYLGREQYRGVAVGQAVVEKLTAGLENKNFHIFYDSYFTSVSLAKSLFVKKIFTCGTIVRNRKGFPADLKNVPNMKQGEFLIRQDGNLTATLWMDSKPVAVLSTAASPLDRSTNASRRLKDGTVISVPRPESVGLYQQYFRGVDIFDQLRSKYPVGRPSKTWWKYVLHFLINTAIINAFILMKESLPSLPKKKYRQLDYRIALAQQLIGKFSTPVKATSRKIQLQPPMFHKLAKISMKRSYCKNCFKSTPKKRKDTLYGCVLCDVHLCGKQCFTVFHGFPNTEE